MLSARIAGGLGGFNPLSSLQQPPSSGKFQPTQGVTATPLAVAAPDHKIRQCFQRSAFFPGRAGERSKGPKRGAGVAKRRGGGVSGHL